MLVKSRALSKMSEKEDVKHGERTKRQQKPNTNFRQGQRYSLEIHKSVICPLWRSRFETKRERQSKQRKYIMKFQVFAAMSVQIPISTIVQPCEWIPKVLKEIFASISREQTNSLLRMEAFCPLQTMVSISVCHGADQSIPNMYSVDSGDLKLTLPRF